MNARWLDAALTVDCGEGFEIKHGERAGQIKYTRQPRAKYECLLCRTVEGPVTGPEAVKRFASTIRTAHICNAPARSQQAA
jgi:hypothetical protein